MQIQGSERELETIAAQRITLARGSSILWPLEQPIQEMGDPSIFATYFYDEDFVREEMRQQVLHSYRTLPRNVPGFGGTKVRDQATWSSPAGQLFTQRALLYFCRTHQETSAHTVDRWANVTEHGDYSAPHAHYEATASVVYYLDLGDAVPGHPLSGKFEILDPRLPFCCSSRPETPTRAIVPEVQPGVMLIFPARLIHFVHPYQGLRPRITLVWNISAGPEPAGNEARLTQPVAGSLGNMK